MLYSIIQYAYCIMLVICYILYYIRLGYVMLYYIYVRLYVRLYVARNMYLFEDALSQLSAGSAELWSEMLSSASRHAGDL